MNITVRYFVAVIINHQYYCKIPHGVPTFVFYIKDDRYDSSTNGEQLTLVAKPNTTWQEWVDSEYNELGLTISGNYIFSGVVFCVGYTNSYNRVSPSEIISEGETYRFIMIA